MRKFNNFASRNLLFIILIVAAFLRLWNLGTNPPSLTPDEAALGYNAYSILKTGRDEYGTFLPIIFKSFGDFKPGFYIYSAVPFIAIFGLTEFAVRLPSALAGILAVWLVFLIVREFGRFGESHEKIANVKWQMANWTAFLLAISPWHIHFSRGAWEVNLALTLVLAAVLFFLKALTNTKFLIYSSAFFALSLSSYQGAKLSALIVVLLLVLVFWEQTKVWLINRRQRLVVGRAILIGIFLSLPIILSFFSGQTGRLKVFSVFSYQRPQEYLQEQLELGKVELGSPKYYLFYSESLNTFRGIAGRWFNHFSGRFLFFDGDWANPRHSAPDTGEMLLADMIFLVVGLFALTKFKSKGAKFILGWLILAPLPAALSRDQVHAVRAFNMVVPLTMITAFGISYVFERLGKSGSTSLKLRGVKRMGFVVAIGALYLGSFVIFLDNFFVHQPVHNSQYWEYGYKQIVETVNPIQNNYHTVHIRQSYAQPYIYFLFYQKYDPAKYQKQASLIESEYGDVGRVEYLDNISFLPIDWTLNRGDFGTLFVADPIRIPPEDSKDPREFKVIKEIKYLDEKETAFRIIEVLDKENIN